MSYTANTLFLGPGYFRILELAEVICLFGSFLLQSSRQVYGAVEAGLPLRFSGGDSQLSISYADGLFTRLLRAQHVSQFADGVRDLLHRYITKTKNKALMRSFS